MVFDHLTKILAPWSVNMMSPLANCLDGSKVTVECGKIFDIRKNVKKANAYNAVNWIGNCKVCVTSRML